MEPDNDNATGERARDLVVADRYRLIALAGAGGMGRVWRAHDDLLDREVAVKEVLAPDGLPYMDRTEILRNTVREARAAARLDHPNVIRVFDVVRAAGRSWIVMEYVSSRSLYDIVTRDGPLAHRHAARIGLTLLDALDAAHRAGVLHRDVKPSNVLIAEDGRVVLTDFGLATMVAVPAGRDEPLLGSPRYIAPERLRDGVSSREADLWSLGATLYLSVEGRPPYARPKVADSLTALLSEAPDPPQRPGPLHTVIAGLLVADPQQRLTADAARSALRDLTRRALGGHAVP
ncbi:serine/threonine-protein kinase, partial [Actinoplanes subglobosus]